MNWPLFGLAAVALLSIGPGRAKAGTLASDGLPGATEAIPNAARGAGFGRMPLNEVADLITSKLAFQGDFLTNTAGHFRGPDVPGFCPPVLSSFANFPTSIPGSSHVVLTPENVMPITPLTTFANPADPLAAVDASVIARPVFPLIDESEQLEPVELMIVILLVMGAPALLSYYSQRRENTRPKPVPRRLRLDPEAFLLPNTAQRIIPRNDRAS